MDAPEKIYVHEASAPELTDNLPYHIEYTRTDAFIEKACQYIRSHSALLDSDGNDCQLEWLEKFKKAMKGE